MPGALTRWDPFAEVAELRTKVANCRAIEGTGRHYGFIN